MNDWKFDDDFDQIERDLRQGVAQACEDTAKAVVKFAQSNAPVLSGALRASGYVKTRRKSGYSKAASDVGRLNPKAHEQLEPEMPLQFLDADVEQAIVDFCVTYASLIAYGAYNPVAARYIAGRDFFGPAFQSQKDAFETRLSRIVEHIKS